MNCLRILSMTVVLACFSSISQAQSQSQAPANTFFVKIENLNVDNYASLYHLVKADGRFVIDLACVPAHILTVKMTGNPDADMAKNLQNFQALASNAQLSQVIHLSDYNAARFFETCSAARQ